MKKTLFILFLISLVLISGCYQRTLPQPGQKLVIGTVVDANIQTPHPYPNSEEGRQIVWSYEINELNATGIRLHFENFDVAGIINPVGYIVEYPPCAPSGFDPGNQSVPEVPSATEELCGNVTIPYTPQEIYDNNYVEGDFFLVKDENGNIIDILSRSSNIIPTYYIIPPKDEVDAAKWWYTYDSNHIIIELHADESENAYGLYIDKYGRKVV